MKTNGDVLVGHAERLGMRTEASRKTLEEVQATMRWVTVESERPIMARMMLRYGWMTSEARDWLSREYPQC